MSLFFSHTVFGTATENFVKSVTNSGWSGLLPAPGLADAHNCRPYHLVVKRDKKYFWNHVHVFPTSFTLFDILIDGEVDDGNNNEEERAAKAVDIDMTSTELASFERTLTFEAKGKLGAAFSSETADLEGDEMVNLTVNLGKIVERSLDIPKLVKNIGNRKINFKNDFIQEVMSNKRNTLCVVVTSLNADKGSELTTEVKFDGSTKLDVHIGASSEIDVDGSILTDRKRSLQLPPDTPIAFRMLEILVKSDGNMQLMVLPGNEGGFEKKLKPRGPKESSAGGEELIGTLNEEEIRRELRPLLSLAAEDLETVRSSFMSLLLESTITLKSFSLLFCEAVNLLPIRKDGKEISQNAMREMLRCKVFAPYKKLLQLTGFSFQDDNIIYPRADRTNLLVCTSSLLELLADLNDDQCRMLYDCSAEERVLLIKMLADMLPVYQLPMDHPSVSALFLGSKRAEAIAFSLGFQLERKSGQWSVAWSKRAPPEPKDDDPTPEKMLLLMIALWSED